MSFPLRQERTRAEERDFYGRHKVCEKGAPPRLEGGRDFMNSTETLKLNKDFRRLYYRGKCAVARTVVLYAQKNRLQKSRIGLTCGKSVGKAFARNRAKRLMRESFRALSPEMKKGYDIVIIARTAINGKTCGEVLKDLRYAAEKLDMML